jgi:transposase
VWHLLLWQHLTGLRIQQHRVKCPTCGWRLERLPGVDRYHRVTTALAALVPELCKVMTLKAVALFQGLHRETVKNLDKRALQSLQATRPLDGITALGIDELAVGPGQTYWHLVSALKGPRGSEMLFVGKGRKERHLAKFWRWWGPARTHAITHAVMDMWKPFRKSFLKRCPSVKIIYDKFHVIRHLLNALNEVRKAELKKAGDRFRDVLAGKKFILLSRRAHVRGKSRDALNLLLRLNRRLLKAHLLKESFERLWSYTSPTWARKFWADWVAQLKWSRLKPYHQFAKLVEGHLEGILAYCEAPVSLGFIESANLKARNVVRMAYGYRDHDYCKLKIIQACTPWMREFRPWEGPHPYLSSSPCNIPS